MQKILLCFEKLGTIMHVMRRNYYKSRPMVKKIRKILAIFSVF